MKTKQMNAINPRNTKLAQNPRLSANKPKIVGAIAPATVAPENMIPKTDDIPWLLTISLIIVGMIAAPRK